MIWGILIYLIFASGGGSDGMVKDIEKPVKLYVHDEAKAKQIIAINKEMLSEDEAFEKDAKKEKKQLAELERNRLASGTEFDEVFAALNQKRADIREKIIDGHFKMKGLMTAEEWGKVYATADRKN